jgi:long-chain acyl-CoA synthetase
MKNGPLYPVEKIADLREMLNLSSKKYAEKYAFLTKDESGSYCGITYKKFRDDVESLGTFLYEKVGKDTKVAIIGQNCYEWAVCYLASVNGLGTVVPIDKELPEEEVCSLLDRSGAQIVIYSEKHREKIEKIKNKLPKTEYLINMHVKSSENELFLYDLITEGKKMLDDGQMRYLECDIDRNDMKVLLFTSGTTAVSKGVMLSQTNICENLMAMCSMTYIGDDDIFLSVLPLHHTYECTCGFLCPIYRGSTIAFCEGLRQIQTNLKEAKATMMLGVPLLFEGMYKKIIEKATQNKATAGKFAFALKLTRSLRKVGIDLRRILFKQIHDAFGGSLRMLVCGAAAIDPDISKGFRDLGILTIQGYGLTEASPIVALNRNNYYKDEAAGLPLPNLTVEIADADDDGVGEIVAKGPSIMLGYYNDEAATQAVLMNGWLHTGDLGYIDAECFVHITGRKKNVIITKNGKNVFPEELEAKLLKSPYIAEVVVKEEQSDSDETIIAAIIHPNIDKVIEDFKTGVIKEPDVNAIIRNVVKEYNRDAVIFKKIKKYTIQDEEFEKTTTKKIKRFLVK